MKIISVPLGRAMWLLDFDKINPRGRSLLDTFRAIAERYRFAKYPVHLLDFGEGGGLKFLSGTFQRGELDLRVGLTVFNNGIQADTLSSTEDAEALLEDLRTWLRDEFNLPIEDEASIRKSYQSQLNVQPEAELKLFNPKIFSLEKALTSESIAVDGKQRQYSMGGFSIFPQDAGADGAPLPFRFERKWGIPPEKGIFFSQAQLRTSEHFAVLEALEKACS
jgi:hypothetical protein